MRQNPIPAVLMAACLLLSAWVAVAAASGGRPESTVSTAAYSRRTEDREADASQPVPEAAAPAQPENYPRLVAGKLLEQLAGPETGERETALRVYNYLISHVTFSDPVGLDIWRYRSNQTEPPTYVENRSLSPILFGVGSCEDYAAAMTVLLQEAGMEAMYVAGYTLSYRGGYTDHAWVVAEIDGNWYHFDPQLEQDIYSGGKIPYRFFMASDEEMRRSHLWGEALIRFCGGNATEEEVLRIRREYAPPPCTAAAEKPDAAEVGVPEKPDLEALFGQIEAEKAGHPPLDEIRLDTDPPVLVAAQPLVEIN